MHLKRIYLRGFRNYHHLDLDLDPKLNVVIGPNAAGKTNLLESIYLLSTAGSHRTHRLAELINWESDHLYVKCLLVKGDTSLTLEFYYDRGNKKVFKVNGVAQRKLTDLWNQLRCVLFAPEDLELVKGGPDKRRAFLDDHMSRTDAVYHAKMREYEKILRQRNEFLKGVARGEQDRSLLSVWNEQLAQRAAVLVTKRRDFVEEMGPELLSHYRDLSQRDVSLHMEYRSTVREYDDYEDSHSLQLSFRQQLQDRFQEEVEKGYTVVGPHRDDLSFTIDGKEVRTYGSQGQQRTVVLSLKIAVLFWLRRKAGDFPVFLLDDVFSELDERRRRRLLEKTADTTQTLITSAESGPVAGLKSRAAVWRVSGGKVCRASGVDR